MKNGNCMQCNKEMKLINNARKYCTDCVRERIRVRRIKSAKADRKKYPNRAKEWREKYPDKYKAKNTKAWERKRRLLQLAEASIELIPELKELL